MRRRGEERWQGRDGGCKQGVDFSSVGHRRRFSGWKPTSIEELSLENRLLQLTGFLDPAAEKENKVKKELCKIEGEVERETSAVELSARAKMRVVSIVAL